MTVVALSVDPRRADAIDAIAGKARPTFERAWDPRAADILRASRVPSTYVVGKERLVVEVVEGVDTEVRARIAAAVAAEVERAR